MNKQIILVEDEDDIRTVLAISLRKRGYDVSEFSDGETAIESPAIADADIAIIDSGLPGMSGIELGRRLSTAGPKGSTAPKMILFSGTDLATIRQEVAQAGFQLVLMKPVAINELCANLDQLLTSQQSTSP